MDVRGDAVVADLLRDAGYGPGDAASPADAVVLAGAAASPGAAADAALALRPGVLLAVDGDAGGADAGSGRLAARLAAADPRPGIRSRRVARALLAADVTVWCVETGDRGRRHELTFTGGAGRVRPGRRPVVLAAAGAPPVAALEAAIGAASNATAAVSDRGATRVLASGAVMAELELRGHGRHLLRIAGGGAARLLVHGAAMQRELLSGAGPTTRAVLAPRLVLPAAEGALGPLRWTLEPAVGGGHPLQVSDALLEDCLEFLAALRAVPAGGGCDMAAQAAVLAAHVDAAGAAALERVAAALDERLAGIGVGWGHGDFWGANLLVRDGRLTTVLDWDSAGPAHLPLLDLFHLLMHADRATRRLSLGEGCRRQLWPLARAGTDARIRRHCIDTGTPSDPDTLEALAVAYWLTRAARDLRTFADRAHRPKWMDANVHRPLAALQGAGW